MLTFTPHKYQETAIVKLISQAHAGLFLDPGLGKTAIALSAFKILKDKGLVDRLYVIAPLLVCYSSWPGELKKWAHFQGLTYTIVHGKDKAENLELDVDVYLINPEAVQWLFDPEAPKFRMSNCLGERNVLCIDESTRFKSSASKRFKVLKKWLYLFCRRWIMTGTPVPHSLQDLFSQIYLLDEGSALGRYITHFRNEYMYQPNPYQKYNWQFVPGAIDTISDKIAPLVVRMKAEDLIDMPELIFNDVYIELDAKSREHYVRVEQEFFDLIEDEAVVAANAGVAGNKCRQIANGAVYLEETPNWVPVHDHKLDALELIMEELGDKPKLLLYEFKHDRQRILEKYPDIEILSGASPTKAEYMIERFNRGEIPTMMGHPASMGHGLNIQANCNHVIWFGITWNYEHYDQAIRRVYRQGQMSGSVIVHRIIARGTRDEVVASNLLDKEATQESVHRAVIKMQSLLY